MSSFSEQGLRISKNVLFNVFVGRAAKLLGKPFKVVTILNETADKLADKGSKTNKFRQLFDVAFTLVRMVRSFISGEYRDIPTSTVVSGLAVLLYVLSPIDLVPDFIPVVGFLDDLSLISWFGNQPLQRVGGNRPGPGHHRADFSGPAGCRRSPRFGRRHAAQRCGVGSFVSTAFRPCLFNRKS